MNALDYLLIGLLILCLVVLFGQRRQVRVAVAQARRAAWARAEAVAAQAEDAATLQRWRAYLDGLGAATANGLLLLDGDRQVVWANGGAWQMFAAAEPAVGHTFISLVHDYELNQAVLDATAGNRSIVRQAVIDGRTLRIWVAPVGGAPGAAAVDAPAAAVALPAASEPTGAAIAIEDVTELQRLGRARRDFVANISHELRTPLANIDLAAQTLGNASGDPAVTQRMLERIQSQVQVLSQLSEEMMELAQIESGQVLLKLLPTDLEPLLRRSVASLLPQSTLKGQHISVLAPEGLRALMDEQQVGRVLNNLLHNAVKFTPEGGIISVYAERLDGDDVKVCVADTGPGIPTAERARVFERFYKHDRARSKGGTGLGLAIARHIVEGHGGRIWVESEPGQGATFCFTLPVG